ncbi:MAG: putative lipopolysaccharide heptosyltransferase III [Deltaproteobacteria bacterium]|nr:putative lipopolysaccharide heptosyltransferase III [Deltaproteobacteria bacterium]
MPNFENILVIKLKQLGDVLLSTPVLTALKEAWPGVRVTYLVGRGTEEMLTDHPLLDGLMVVDRCRDTWSQTVTLLRRLRQARFDLVLEMSGGDRGAFYTWVSGARDRLGFQKLRQPLWQRRGSFTRLLPRPPVTAHTVEHNLAMLAALGVAGRQPPLSFFWNDAVHRRVQDLLRRHRLQPQSFVVMHPGAGWSFKSWTPEGYARVATALEQDRGLRVVLTGAPLEREERLAAAILEKCRGGPLNLVGHLTVKELGALMAQARFFFGVDSAPMHLAAAVGTPAAALFGPTGDFNWRPWGRGHLVIRKDWDCIPCGRDGCEGTKVSRCLTELTPAEVLERLQRWMNQFQGGDPMSLAPPEPLTLP